MKTALYISFFFMFSNFIKSQNNYYLGISNITVSQFNTQQIKVNLKVTGGSYGEYASYKTNINQNQITLSVCYNMTDFAVMTYFDNDFYIDIPPVPNTYNLKVDVYYSDGPVCNYIYLDDTENLNFTTPIQGAVSLSANENDFSEKNLKLFPIPAKDVLNILTNNKIEKIDVYDVSGKKIPANIQNNKVNTSSLKNGIYFIDLFLDNKRIRRKFSIQK